tara:strand:+ start:490 stop:945 length:456 start_codon:yes stop_codon:yes gene_type:complete
MKSAILLFLLERVSPLRITYVPHNGANEPRAIPVPLMVAELEADRMLAEGRDGACVKELTVVREMAQRTGMSAVGWMYDEALHAIALTRQVNNTMYVHAIGCDDCLSGTRLVAAMSRVSKKQGIVFEDTVSQRWRVAYAYYSDDAAFGGEG